MKKLITIMLLCGLVLTGCGNFSEKSEDPVSKIDENNFNITTDTSNENNPSISSDSSTNDSSSTISSSEVSPDFKARMDEYEAFFNGYVDFMKQYNANPNDIELASSYSDYEQKYFDYMDELKNCGSDPNLSSADLSYFVNVDSRITQKLKEIN